MRVAMIAGLVGLALASASAPTRAELPSDAPLPSCLDRTMKEELSADLVPRGVQAKPFLKRHKFELTARGGLFGGDLTSSSWIAGGALGFWFTEDLALEATVELSPMALDLDAPLAEFFGDDRFEPATALLAMGNLVWSPIHAKVKIGDSIVHTDIRLYAGAGRLVHDSVQGITVNAGFALDLLLSKYVTLRLDGRDVMAVQEAVTETRFTNNLVVTLGIAFWIPTGL